MELVRLIEIVDNERLEQVKKCTNIHSIQDCKGSFDIKWQETLKTILQKKKPKQSVTYKQIDKGRFFGQGLQSFPRQVRKYLCNNMYYDIDMVNAHPSIVYNEMKKYNIKIPKFLLEYMSDRQSVINRYKLTDKLFVIKLLNTENFNDKRKDILEFHKVLYGNKIIHLLYLIKKQI